MAHFLMSHFLQVSAPISSLLYDLSDLSFVSLEPILILFCVLFLSLSNMKYIYLLIACLPPKEDSFFWFVHCSFTPLSELSITRCSCSKNCVYDKGMRASERAPLTTEATKTMASPKELTRPSRNEGTFLVLRSVFQGITNCKQCPSLLP